MNHRRIGFAVAAAAALSLSPAARAADEPVAQPPPDVPRCEVAVVSPVSGFAECVKPRGVPVAPPPAHPAPSAEECRRHADLDLKGCEEGAPPPQSNGPA